MKRHLLTWVLLVLWPVALGYAQDDRLKKLGFMVQDGVVESPDFITEDAAGNRVDSASFRGKVVVLNFWATWCPPCRLEMPAMEQLYREFRDKGLEVVAVNFMESAELVRAFAEEQKLTYPMLLDNKAEIAERYGVMRLPETVLIGRKGELIAKTIGYKEWYKDDVRELVAALLGEEKPGPVAAKADTGGADIPAEAPPSGGYGLTVAVGLGGLVLAGLVVFRIRRALARRRGPAS